MKRRTHRITAYPPADLFREFKSRCAEHDDTMAKVLVASMKEYLRVHPPKPRLVD